MPAVNITTTAAKAFDVPVGKWGFTIRNVSDVTIYLRLSKAVAVSGDNMGMPLDPGGEKTFCFAERSRNSIAVMALHGGSGNKSLVYDFLETQLQAVFGGGDSATLSYQTVAASASDQVLGSTGAIGDYLSGLLLVPDTTSPGAVSIKDGSGGDITVFSGGASSVSNLVPFFVPLGIKSNNGAWKVTTGSHVTAIGVGKFT